MVTVFIDGDGCAVKDETYKVAARYKLKVVLVANKPMHIPLDANIEMKVVSGNFDAADDWIAEKIEANDILITADILLADRAIKKQARVLGPKGKEFTEDNIGHAVGTRELMSHLRNLGQTGTGPAPMSKNDRSQFLSKLDQITQAAMRAKK